ncbi:MAG: hypothetical protein HZB39_18580 [Planctomycetes bacterium]|nr:hypothetical protein [Planctomycetota bacterium]
MPKLNRSIVDSHEQKYCLSCIPACVELVLKLLKKVDGAYYSQQDAWQNKSDGSFGDFNGTTLFGVTFRHLFHGHARGAAFPMNELLSKVEEQLASDHFVIVSLASLGGWHMYVIYEKRGNEYAAVSKQCKITIECSAVRATITAMGGTDLLVYEDA